MSHSITVRHHFEAAHRLPHLDGKCQSLHGHSWRVEVTATVPTLTHEGLVVEFGAFKTGLRDWIDSNLDHGTMLGGLDPLARALRVHGCKVYRFNDASRLWPTVENVAALLADVAAELLVKQDTGARVTRVTVHETHANTAEWTPA